MGTDIHGVIQVKKDGKWITIQEGYPHRNYEAFSILADVRNGYGFAGCPTGDAFEPIAQPRGLPDDIDFIDEYRIACPPDFYCPERWIEGLPAQSAEERLTQVKRKIFVEESEESESAKWARRREQWYRDEGIEFGDHSHSYVSLRELLDVKWSTPIKRTGVLSSQAYDTWNRGSGSPESWCGGVSGPEVVTHEEKSYLKLKNTGKLPKGSNYVRCYWTVTYRDAVGRDFMDWIDRLRPLAAEYGGEDNVRFVFGFDS